MSDCYCCIGVLGAVCGVPQNKMKGRGIFGEQDFNSDELLTIQQDYKFPKILLGSIYSDEEDFNKITEKLANFNDGGKSFKWIASWIDKNL